jgi:hypothetical protein
MPEIQFIKQDSGQILLIDLGGVSAPGLLQAAIGKAVMFAGSSGGPGTLRTLIDLTGTRITKEVIASLKNLSRSNGRYAKATAFVGLGAGWWMILSLLFLVRGKRNHKVLSDRAKAIYWLDQW